MRLKVTTQRTETFTYYVETGEKSMLDFTADGDLRKAERLHPTLSYGPASMTITDEE